MNRFVESVARVLEVDALALDNEFRSAPGWCSLQAFGLLVLMENDWGAPISIDRLGELKTVRDLYREAFLAFAAGVFKTQRSRLSGETRYGEIAEWDSVNHLRLVMETEKRFGVSFALEKIPYLCKLEDFLI